MIDIYMIAIPNASQVINKQITFSTPIVIL